MLDPVQTMPPKKVPSSRMSAVTATDPMADSAKEAGRYGDTEMAHVTPGEIVIPLTIQTPEVMAAVKMAFEQAGVPMERYIVGTTENSTNPETGEDEYFLKNIIKGITGAVGGFFTGGPAGALAGGVSGLMSGGGGSSSGGGGGSAQAPQQPPSVTGNTTAAQTSPAAPIGLSRLQALTTASPESQTLPSGTPPKGQDYASYSPRGGASAGTFEGWSPTTSYSPKSYNPMTGKPEFYDMGMRMSTASRNPKTGYQEYAAPMTSAPMGMKGGTAPYGLYAPPKAPVTTPTSYSVPGYPTLAQNPYQAPAASTPAASTSPTTSTTSATSPAASTSTNTSAATSASPSPTGASSTTTAASSAPNINASLPQFNGLANQNQNVKRQVGYTGSFDNANDWQNWARSNPDSYLKYVEQIKASDANFTPNVDFDITMPGMQTFTKDLNKALGRTVSYAGDTGTGQLGSGQAGIDYISLNPQYRAQYEKIRQLFEPGYKYNESSVLPADFNEAEYLRLNPEVAAAVKAGQFTSGAHQYNTKGKAAGANYKEPAVNPEMKTLLDRIKELETRLGGGVTSQANTPINQISSLSPARAPRFRSRRYRGGLAANF